MSDTSACENSNIFLAITIENWIKECYIHEEHLKKETIMLDGF